ncbi:hypothetical protein, conserved [Eimeria maxima]|uniref:Transmembrane protein n=1 Tax=Eimeria maxima TaxID=5804 RepID=U6LWT3_EIMMA|nr:hypothetical protein, conserved [Eimeria maxima]CDJ56417.1 hypothetical protein, conserved [Eimeria maxima]
MGFQNKRNLLGVHLLLILTLGWRAVWPAAGLETFTASVTPDLLDPWSSYLTTHSDVTSPFFDVSEGVSDEPVPQKTPSEPPASPTRRGRIFRKLAVLVALGISVAVAVQIHRRKSTNFAKHRQDRAPPSNRNALLQQVRGLFKSASMTNAALEAPEATELIGKLRKNLEKAERAQREGRAAAELHASVDAAISCVEMLRNKIIEHAETIAQGSKVISLHPLLDANNPDPVAEMKILKAYDETAVGPFLQYLSSVYNFSEALFIRTKKIHGCLMESAILSQNDDGQWLESSALKVNSLLSTLEAQQYTERLAKGLVSGSLSGLKVTMLAEREAKRWRLQLSLDQVRMLLQQTQRALQNISGSAEEASLQEKGLFLKKVEREVQEISDKVSGLSIPAKSIRKSGTLQDMFAVCSACQQAEDEVSADLDRILGVLTEFEPKVEDLDKASKEFMEELTEKYRKLFAWKDEITQRCYYNVQGKLANIIKEGTFPSATAAQMQHARVARGILKRMDQSMEASKREMGYGESALRVLNSMDKVSTAGQVLEGLKNIGNSIIQMKQQALLQFLSLHLIDILQQDVDHMTQNEATIAAHPHYPFVDKQKMQVLESGFKAAKESMESAGSLKEMTEAAVAMRTYYSEMEELVYEPRRQTYEKSCFPVCSKPFLGSAAYLVGHVKML